MGLPKPVESFTFATVVVTLDAPWGQKHCKAAFYFVYPHNLLDSGKNWTYIFRYIQIRDFLAGAFWGCLSFNSIITHSSTRCQRHYDGRSLWYLVILAFAVGLFFTVSVDLNFKYYFNIFGWLHFATIGKLNRTRIDRYM